MISIPNGKKTVLDNGLRILTEEIPAMRSVALGIMAGVGSGEEPPELAGISHYIEHMMFKGTSKRSAYDIAHALDAVGGKLNAYTSKEITLYYAVVLDRHIEIAIDVLSDMVLGSIYDPKEMELEKGVVLEEIKMYEDTPDELIHDYFASCILAGHPLGRPTLGQAETIASLTREKLLQYVHDYYSPKNLIISLAGAVPADAAERLAARFGTLDRAQTPQPQPPSQHQSGVFLKRKKTEQAHLCLGGEGPSHEAEDRYAFAVLDVILGGTMSSRLFQEVREKRGLAYAIYSTTSPFRSTGLSYVYSGTSPENISQVVEIILSQFTLLKREGLSVAELERAKEYLKGSLVLGMESSSARMGYLAKSELHHGRIVPIDEIFGKIDRVDNEAVIAAANRYFDLQKLALAVIADLEELPVKSLV